MSPDADRIGNMHYTCPQCSHALEATRSDWTCSSCHTVYPQLDGIPWLLPQPKEQLAAWQLKLQALLQHLDAEAESYKDELKRPGLATLTQKRLRKMLQAKVEHKKALIEILQPLARQESVTPEVIQAAGIQIPSGQTLTGYYVNVHRDWAWDTAENAASLHIVRSLLGMNAKLGDMLVLGAGACRLPYDLYQAYKPKTLIAADINPFMLLTTKRILRGKSVKLYEFPLAPRDLESHAVLRKCAAPTPVDERFQLLFADALKAPFAPHSFDTVMTPWLVDILPYDLKFITQSVNRLLKPGGLWLNFGSLAFNHVHQALNYSLEETLEVIQSHGFLVADTHKDQIPYMQSPASHHGRLETVFSFAAIKQKECDQTAIPDYQPGWLRDLNHAVPLVQAFQAARVVHTIYTDVLALVDGQRSIMDIAQIFGARHTMQREEAAESLRNFFAKMWEESRMGRAF